MNTDWRKKLLGFLVAVGLLFGTGPGWAETIKLRCAAGHPYASAIWVETLRDFFCAEVEKRVAERTKYKAKIQQFYGGSLAKLGEILEAVETGVADIGLPMSIFDYAKLYLHNYTWWAPFTTSDMYQMLRAHHRVVSKYPIFDEIMESYNQKILAWVPVDSQQLVTTFPVRTLADLKGKKVANGGPLIPWLAGLGCVGVQSRLNEAYTSLQTGLYEGWATSTNPIIGFKLYEQAPYLTIVDFGVFSCALLTVNLNTWARLPKEVRAIMVEVAKEYEKKLSENTLAKSAKGMKLMKEKGVKFYQLPPEERGRWSEVLYNAGVASKSAREADAKGWPGTAILRDYLDALEKEGYKFPYRPKP